MWMSVRRTHVMATPIAPTHPDPSPVSVFPVSKAMGSTAPSQVVSANTHISVLFFSTVNNRNINHHRRSNYLSFENPSPLLVKQCVSDSDGLNNDDEGCFFLILDLKLHIAFQKYLM